MNFLTIAGAIACQTCLIHKRQDVLLGLPPGVLGYETRIPMIQAIVTL